MSAIANAMTATVSNPIARFFFDDGEIPCGSSPKKLTFYII
jgi:hypothetical protein